MKKFVLVAELEIARKNVREKAEEEARNLREEVDSLKGKTEVKNEVSVRPKNRVEEGISGNGTEQFRLNNVKEESNITRHRED